MTKNVLCPLLKKPCIGHECAWFAHVVGRDPQTGRDVDHWDCSVRWLPMMMTAQARETRGVHAAVESMRNEVVKRQDAAAEIAPLAAAALAGRAKDITPTLQQLEG